MADAYPERDGRTYRKHGIETTLDQFEDGDRIQVDCANEAYSGTYVFEAYSIDPDLHVTLRDPTDDNRVCGIRRCVSNRDKLLFIPSDTLLAETTVVNVAQATKTMPESPTTTTQTPSAANAQSEPSRQSETTVTEPTVPEAEVETSEDQFTVEAFF